MSNVRHIQVFQHSMTETLIERIRSGTLSEKELINLYNNARVRNAENVIKAIERQMRGQFPKAANRLFGKKESYAIQRLQEVLARLEREVKVSDNELKNGVKPGGKKLAGEKYLNVYASYRNAAGVGGYLSMEQDTIDSELYAIVGHYKIGAAGFRHEERFTMEAFDDAAAKYIDIVKGVAGA